MEDPEKRVPDEHRTLTRVSDAASLRALAHPLRQRLYEQLVLFGPLTATELAARLDDTPSNCSWHLRKLAEHGYVEESADGATGRRRPWQAAVRGLTWGDEDDPEARRAGDSLTRMVVARELERLSTAWARLPEDDPGWQEAANATQSMLWLTPEELAEVNTSVAQVLLAKRGRHEDPTQRPPGSRLCAFLAWGVPTYDLADPTPADTPAQTPAGER